MRKERTYAIAIRYVGVVVIVTALAQAKGQPPVMPRPNPDSQYRLGPDSLPQDGVPKGLIRGPFTLVSQV